MRTALDLAGLRNHEEVVRFLDQMAAQQAALSSKLVRRMKTNALTEANQRVRKYNKMQEKANKKAERQDRRLAEATGKTGGSTLNVKSTRSGVSTEGVYNSSKVRPTVKNFFGTVTSRKSTVSTDPQPFSSHYNATMTSTTSSRRLGIGVFKKTQLKKSQHEVGDDFKVGHIEMNGQRTIRSITGLKRDNHIMYRRGESMVDDTVSTSVDTGTGTMRADTLSRAISEPDFTYVDSGVGSDDSTPPPEASSMFERKGMGTLCFIRKFETSDLLRDLPANADDANEVDRHSEVQPVPSTSTMAGGRSDVRPSRGVAGRIARKNSYTDSIGTVGSLAARMHHIPWDDDDVNKLDDDEEESSPLEMFLVASDLVSFLPFFTSESVDLDTLMLLTNDDLKELDIPLGPRKKLIAAIAKRNITLEQPGAIIDTPLW